MRGRRMSAMLSRYLKDFSAPPAPVAPVISDFSFVDEPFVPEEPPEPPVDVEAERRDAFAQGHQAATLALTERHNGELAALADAHRAELEALRASYELQAAERIASDLKTISASLGQAVSAEAAKAIAPVMTETLSRGAVDELSTLVQAAILDGSVGQIVVAGPKPLFDRLAANLGDHAALLRHVEASDVDLTVTIGDGVLVTRMSAWADSLRKILE